MNETRINDRIHCAAIAATILLALICSQSRAADPLFVTVDGRSYPALPVTGAVVATVTAPLIYGGIGSAPNQQWGGKVVLLDRGEITFAAKVKNVKDAGGLATVIANNVAGGTTATIAPDTSTIPAVTVTKADGAILQTKVGSTARVGTAPPAVVLPDPTGRAGEFLYSDGQQLVFSKNAAPNPSVTLSFTVAAGQPASLTVNGWGAPPYTFQWAKNGANIAGATTSVLIFQATTANDAGTYTCLVSNANGATTTAPSTLSVK